MKKRLCPQLQWARAARGEVRVLAVGARRALVENHRGVLEYDAQKVLLRSADGRWPCAEAAWRCAKSAQTP